MFHQLPDESHNVSAPCGSLLQDGLCCAAQFTIRRGRPQYDLIRRQRLVGRLVQQHQCRLLDSRVRVLERCLESRAVCRRGQSEHQHVLQHRIQVARQGVNQCGDRGRVATMHERFRSGHADVCLRVLQQCREPRSCLFVAAPRHRPCRQCCQFGVFPIQDLTQGLAGLIRADRGQCPDRMARGHGTVVGSSDTAFVRDFRPHRICLTPQHRCRAR